MNKKNRQHYIKWPMNEDMSIRYYFLFEDRPEFEKKYVIKSHNSKLYETISVNMAKKLIKELTLKFTKTEVIGEKVIDENKNINYRKIIIQNDKILNVEFE